MQVSLHFDQVLHQHSSSDSKLQIAYCKLLPLYSTCMQRSYSTLPGLAAAVCSYRSDICDTSLPALEASVVADHILQFSRMLSTLSPIAPDEDNPTVAAIDVTFITARVGIYNLPAIWGPATRLEFGITPLLRMSPHCSQPSAGISSLLPANQPAGFPSSSTSPSVAVAPQIPPVTSAATPTTSGLLPASHVSPSVAGMARKIVGDAGDVFSAAGHTQEDVSGAAGVAQRDTWGVARGTEASDVTMEVVGGAGGASQRGEASTGWISKVPRIPPGRQRGQMTSSGSGTTSFVMPGIPYALIGSILHPMHRWGYMQPVLDDNLPRNADGTRSAELVWLVIFAIALFRVFFDWAGCIYPLSWTFTQNTLSRP